MGCALAYSQCPKSASALPSSVRAALIMGLAVQSLSGTAWVGELVGGWLVGCSKSWAALLLAAVARLHVELCRKDRDFCYEKEGGMEWEWNATN